MKFVSFMTVLIATFAILSSASVPATKAEASVPVQVLDFEDSPIYISVKK